MATAFWKLGWKGRRKMLVVRYRAANGTWVEERRPNDRTKVIALEYAREQERQAALQRKGMAIAVEPVAFGVLWDRWWERDGRRRRSSSKHGFQAALVKHLSSLRSFVLTPATAGAFADQLDALLDGLEDAKALAPQSLNHLRAGVHRMFEVARDPKVNLWVGENPIQWVKRRTVPRSHKPTLAHHEVTPTLEALPAPQLGAPWRWVAAVCLYAGTRPGEAFGLHKADVDLEAGVMTLRHSWGAPLPKDDEPRTVVVVPELRAYLEAAIEASPNELVFPRADGSPFSDNVRFGLVDKLRAAIAKAGIIIGYRHTCRRCKGKAKRGELPKDTVTAWQHPDGEQRTCAACGMKLWAKALPRPLRFYDLRHSHGTLLRRGGVDVGTVQKSLGHSDPRITAQTYDHTELEDRRPQLARVLSFAASKPVAPAVAQPEAGKDEARGALDSAEQPRASMVGATGFEPATTCTPSPSGRPDTGRIGRTEAHRLHDSAGSLRRIPAHSALSAPAVTRNGGTGSGTRLPSAVPSFLEACANLAQQAAERGDFAKAVELMQKAAQVAALREEVA